MSVRSKCYRKHTFRSAWRRLEAAGFCDGPGGAEYRRIYREWVQGGCPLALAFVAVAANREPVPPWMFFAPDPPAMEGGGV